MMFVKRSCVKGSVRSLALLLKLAQTTHGMKALNQVFVNCGRFSRNIR